MVLVVLLGVYGQQREVGEVKRASLCSWFSPSSRSALRSGTQLVSNPMISLPFSAMMAVPHPSATRIKQDQGSRRGHVRGIWRGYLVGIWNPPKPPGFSCGSWAASITFAKVCHRSGNMDDKNPLKMKVSHQPRRDLHDVRPYVLSPLVLYTRN